MELFEHQKKAIEEMHNGCILCGGVGSGKSLTSLVYYFEKIGKGRYRPFEPMDDLNPVDLYIITTAKKRDSNEWTKELSHLNLSVGDTNIGRQKVIVDSWNNIQKYINVEKSFFIFDEQRAIGHGAWVKSFLKISKKNRWILLSATPGDTWMDYIPTFVANGFYKNRTEFIRQHVVFEPWSTFPKIKMYINTERLQKLKEYTLVYMDRQKTAKRNFMKIVCGWDSDKFNLLHNSRRDLYTGKPIENSSQYCACLKRLIFTHSSRMDRVVEILKEHPKAIMFYHYDFELELIKDRLSKEHYIYAEQNGHRHDKLPTGDKWIYLVQYMSGCEGWNCIETDTIIFYSLSPSYRIHEQSCGRIDRLNTPFKNLYYYMLTSSSPLDKGINRALERKEDFNERRFYEKQFTD